MFDSLFKPKKPTAISLAQEELEECQRNLLTHKSNAMYNQKMAEYLQDNINRLSKYTKESDHG